jgi:Icc-related predicted phosphoesterase
MIIAAVSDVHLPRNYESFIWALDKMKAKPDLFLMAGDMVHRGDVKEYEKVKNLLFGKIFCPIISCFGNNEFQDLRDSVRKSCPEIKFLDDQGYELSVAGKNIAIFGTTGSLENPTKWQRSHVPDIERIFKMRMEMADKYLYRMQNMDERILLMHYSPTYKTLEGENPRFFSTMGNNLYENIINARKPTLVVHGHSHHGTKHAWVDGTPVFNVNFSVNREIVIIDTDKVKPGLEKFV